MEQSSRNYSLIDLPLEVVEVIAGYLSVRDLATCCAVSRSMRSIFSDDCIWRPRCDKELCEYLKTTPCRVKPFFKIPKFENNSLGPIHHWKLSFMHENHLWNNWRKGRFIREIIQNQESDESKYHSICHIFLTSDCVIALFPHRIELLDVREYPAAKAAQDINLSSEFKSNLRVIAGDEMVITIYRSLVQVYEVNFSAKKCLLKHAFIFQDSQKAANVNSPEEINLLVNSIKQSYRSTDFTIVRNFLIAIIKGESKMHIWDVKSGLKVREQDCPMKKVAIDTVKACEGMNLILRLTDNKQSDTKIFIVYSLTSFAFLPFKESLQGECEFCMINKYVAVRTMQGLNVYDYEESKVILRNEPIDSNFQSLGNNFVFLQNEILKMYHPLSQQMKHLSLIVPGPEAGVKVDRVCWFEVLSKRFIQVRRDYSLEVYEVIENYYLKKTSMKLWFTSCSYFLNKTSTKYIVRNGYGQVLHFW